MQENFHFGQWRCHFLTFDWLGWPQWRLFELAAVQATSWKDKIVCAQEESLVHKLGYNKTVGIRTLPSDKLLEVGNENVSKYCINSIDQSDGSTAHYYAQNLHTIELIRGTVHTSPLVKSDQNLSSRSQDIAFTVSTNQMPAQLISMRRIWRRSNSSEALSIQVHWWSLVKIRQAVLKISRSQYRPIICQHSSLLCT
jgi:hypothetical protein